MRNRLIVIAAMAAALAAPAPAQIPRQPADTEGIGITEKTGDRIPLELTFTDEQGRTVPLGEYFDGKRPVALTLVYYRCPGICNALLNGLTTTLSEMDWTAGEQFQIVTVSIDPDESHELAGSKKATYLEVYDRQGASAGWHFLVGEQERIQALADAVGFGYRYEQGTGLYTHAASLMIATPDGRLSRYLNDVMFEPRTVRLALVEASQGEVGTPADRILLRWCYSYDPSSGRYVVAARKVMTIGGAVVVILMAAGLGFLWRRELRRHGGREEAAP